MATIPWGKPTIKVAQSINGVPVGDWRTLDTPKEGTTQLNTTAGDKKEAKEEGGKVVDVKYTANNYELEMQLFVKKGMALPFEDNDGLIDGEHAVRLIPEDPSCEGFQIDKSTVRCELTYSSEEGSLLKYVFSALKPAEGNTIKPYTEGSLVVDNTELYFTGANNESQVVTVTTAGTLTAAPVEGDSWITATPGSGIVTIRTSANTTGGRTGHVVITDSNGASVTITIHQARQAS